MNCSCTCAATPKTRATSTSQLSRPGGWTISGALSTIEPALLDYVDELEAAHNDEQKIAVLLSAADEVFLGGGGRGAKKGGLFAFGAPKARAVAGVGATPEVLEAIKYLLVRDKIGLGLLEPLIRDPNIEDISCSGVGPIFIEHKIFKALKTNISFDESDVLDEFVVRLAEKIKKPVTYRHPDLRRDAAGRLPYQHRLRRRCLHARQQLHHP